MTVQEFEKSLENQDPPANVSRLLRALWLERKGDWDEGHAIVQEIPTADASWVHAYLHRREGDLGNAGYWYRRAGKPAESGSLDEEWKVLVEAFLSS